MMWTNVVLISFVSYFTYINADEYMKREFSLVQPYFGTYKMGWSSTFEIEQWIINCFSFFGLKTGAGMSLPYWDFTGSTLVTSNYIRLTPDIQSRSGAIWNSVVRSPIYKLHECNIQRYVFFSFPVFFLCSHVWHKTGR